MTTPDTGRLRFSNPEHPIPEDVSRGLDLYSQERRDALRVRHERERIAGPTKEQAAAKMGLARASARMAGIDIDEYNSQVAQRNRTRLVALEEKADGTPRHRLEPRQTSPDIPRGPIIPDIGEVGYDFWEASWESFWTDPYSADRQSDGIHFKGKMSWDDGSLIQLYFGAQWRLELHPDRIHVPLNKYKWKSEPEVNLFGNLLGYVAEGDIFTGDQWSKCWMNRRQTLFQFIFAPAGVDNMKVIAENEVTEGLVFIENGGVGDSVMIPVSMPGQVAMPPLKVPGGQFYPGVSIWAELEVRFDIQLEGNSLLWLDDEILLQTFQWPLVPKSS